MMINKIFYNIYKVMAEKTKNIPIINEAEDKPVPKVKRIYKKREPQIKDIKPEQPEQPEPKEIIKEVIKNDPQLEMRLKELETKNQQLEEERNKMIDINNNIVDRFKQLHSRTTVQQYQPITNKKGLFNLIK